MSRFDDRYLNFGDVYGIIMQAKTVDQSMNVLHLPYVEMPKWIPVSERLPEEDKEVLITYKGKGDELDKPYSNIDITTYGQMYFGGNKVGNYKHWRSPFQYFNDNYEVTAWMPLPEPYEGGDA